ncbi:tRNA pseudouridine32 synthase / 23S rRNA pseudouridine746 synthase [Oceanospirillum multiglobuliferum]|uniref:TIGR01621 family pseudouridine synthase n=1 Tax=Oceanospirillum multiglobuliferum TaxID=64969 RepID=UPI0009C8A6C2|nr:TIGR01621 family pseudouridine synthase [Oceanospirillum multiglobuliferum]SJZ74901.1 tRNA pseudouridine32 synthase / 23S rRNA pseudouridine746 synthase [Oceanospirillum multiglobuliferum]
MNFVQTSVVASQQLDQGFSLVAETEDFVLINKAPNIDVHRDGDIPGICERVCSALKLPELFLVHRLDKVTSGLLLLAKNTEANQQLSALFRDKQIQKYYLALSDKKPKKKQGWIKGDMERSRRGSWKLLNSQQNPAITQFFTASVGNGLRLFLLKPRTGKTHQLRVAMKSLGAPICGDELYDEASRASQHERTYLHAFALSFELKKQHYQYCCPPTLGALFLAEATRQQWLLWQQPELLAWPN